MPEDRSLDEFVASTDDAADDEAEDVSDDAESEDVSDDAESEDVSDDAESEGVTARSTEDDGDDAVIESTPTPSTSSWTADGADCERCGDAVTRRWRDDGLLVCADCKRWSQSDRGDDGG